MSNNDIERLKNLNKAIVLHEEDKKAIHNIITRLQKSEFGLAWYEAHDEEFERNIKKIAMEREENRRKDIESWEKNKDKPFTI